MSKTIDKIKAKPNAPKRIKVAAYARVSSGKEAMLQSLSAQVSFYNKFIQDHPEWEFAGIYADEAKTGTKEDRPEFQKMIAACKEGKIEMVITKSISRLARNTVTVIKTVRLLKELGIDVYFEEQNIHTLSAEGELMMTIMASFYQEEARSFSSNIKWRIKKDMEEGSIWGGAPQLGYRIEDRKFVVVPEEAKLVKEIYRLYLEDGLGVNAIVRKLNKEGIKPMYSEKWCKTTICEILKNTNYTGDLYLQKTYRIDYLSKKKKRNKGEKPMYLVENNHEAIISKEDFNKVQEIMGQRRLQYNIKNNKGISYPFTSKITCGLCGCHYKHKTTRYNSLWICTKYDELGKDTCQAKQIPEEKLKEAVAKALDWPEFNDNLFKEDVEKITAYKDNVLVIQRKNGKQVTTKWIDPSRRDSWTPEMKEAARQRSLEQMKKRGEA